MGSLWKGLLQNSLLLAGLKAFAASLILTPILRDVFRSYNVVDRPGHRRLHAHPIPRIGGVAIAAAYVIGVFPLDQLSLWKLLPGAAVIFLTGLLDDFFTLKPIFKLAGQTAAALLVFYNGLSVGSLGGRATLPLWLDLPVTVLWVLLTTNALNLIDGLDGLCAGIGSIAALAMFGAALLYGNQPLAYATLPLACALLAFLCYNLSPATVFLGDSGALLIGFLLGCYGMIWTQKRSTLLSLLAPLIALSVPLLDVSVSIFRRTLRRQPIFSADRAHIHHRLLDRGLTPRGAVLVLYGFGAMAAAFALLLITPQLAPFRNGLLLVLIAAVGLGLHELRYKEFELVRRWLFGGELQRNLEESLRLDNLGAALAAAPTWETWWIVLVEAARECGWSRIQWKKHGGASEVSIHPLAVTDWIFSVPLGQMGTIEIQGREGLRGLDLAAFGSVVARSARAFEPPVAARAEAV
jgi:UDP-GlcNAc:undecaprenyl-phosphate/decaprenyl-phosphate GlcNAc-1-phosphate transferase